MKIDIQTHGFTLTDALRTQTERRLRFAFGGLGARVGRVGVRLTDENGPRGGVDKRCALRITVPGQQPRHCGHVHFRKRHHRLVNCCHCAGVSPVAALVECGNLPPTGGSLPR